MLAAASATVRPVSKPVRPARPCASARRSTWILPISSGDDPSEHPALPRWALCVVGIRSERLVGGTLFDPGRPTAARRRHLAGLRARQRGRPADRVADLARSAQAPLQLGAGAGTRMDLGARLARAGAGAGGDPALRRTVRMEREHPGLRSDVRSHRQWRIWTL